MAKVYDVDITLAVRGGIERLLSGNADYQVFIGDSQKTDSKNAGFLPQECYNIYVEVKEDVVKEESS